jgi:hypothetical protein
LRVTTGEFNHTGYALFDDFHNEGITEILRQQGEYTYFVVLMG